MTHIDEIATPALMVDPDALERNLATMAEAHPGPRLRPHDEAHGVIKIPTPLPQLISEIITRIEMGWIVLYRMAIEPFHDLWIAIHADELCEL